MTRARRLYRNQDYFLGVPDSKDTLSILIRDIQDIGMDSGPTLLLRGHSSSDAFCFFVQVSYLNEVYLQSNLVFT